MSDKLYDLIIVGGGPAGLSCGIYAGRARLSTLILERDYPGGQLLFTEKIENYPGFPESIFSSELAERMKGQAERFGTEIKNEEVIGITLEGKEKVISTKGGEKFWAISVVIATGSRYRELKIPGEKELLGKGVSYCGICDGPLFKGKDIAVIGGGDTALEETLFLSRFARKIFLIHRRADFRGVKILQERIFSLSNLEIKRNSVITRIEGKERVEGLRIKNLKTDKEEFLPLEGVFIFIGMKPNTEFLSGFLKLDEEGFIVTDGSLETSIKGIFACGDVRKDSFKQVVNACAEGARAAISVERYIGEFKRENERSRIL